MRLLALLLLLPGTSEVWVRAHPWSAAFTAEHLADALRLRLPAVEVRLVSDEPAAAAVAVVEVVEERIRLVRGDDVLLDATVSGAGEDAGRRAALFTAIALETAPTPAAPVAVIQHAPPRWALLGVVGVALALDDVTPGVAPVLAVRFRPRVGAALVLEVGAKLSGAYEARDVSIVDRAVWAGVGIRAPFRATVATLGLAVQYTDPAVSAAGYPMGLESSFSSRFGARASGDLAFPLGRHLALSFGVAATFNLAEREFGSGGEEVVNLGAATFEVAMGPEVRW